MTPSIFETSMKPKGIWRLRNPHGAAIIQCLPHGSEAELNNCLEMLFQVILYASFVFVGGGSQGPGPSRRDGGKLEVL